MKISDILQRANLFFFLLVILLLGFPDRILIFAFNIWILISVICIVFYWKEIKIHLSFFLTIPIVLYLIQIVLTLISSNKTYGLGLLETKMLFLFVPAIFSFSNYPKVSFTLINKTLIIGFLLSSLYILVKALLFLQQEPNSVAMFNTNFSEFLKVVITKHRSYWSFYALLTAISLYFLYPAVTNKLSRGAIIVLVIIICVNMVVLQARIVLFSFIIVFILILIRRYRISKKRGILIFSFLGVVILVLLMILLLPRFSSLILGETYSLENIRNLDSRGSIWLACYNILKEHWLFGTGFSNRTQILMSAYENIKFYEGVNNQFNAHNQFFESFIEGGVALFFIYLLLYLYPIFLSIKKRYFISFLIGIGLLMFSLFESILIRFFGVVLFLVFLIFLFYEDKDRSSFNENIGQLKKFISTRTISVLTLLLLIFLISFSLFHKTFDPNNPNTYAIVKHQRVNARDYGLNLPGDELKGILFDKTAEFNQNERFSFIYNKIFSKSNLKNDSISAYVWCYTSIDCNVNRIGIALGNNRSEFVEELYDIRKKGTWQKINLNKKIEKGEVSLQLFIADEKEHLKNGLKGKIIFYFPNYQFY